MLAINLIVCSIVPFLVLGPFIPDLIVSISSLFFLFYVIKNNDHQYLINKPFVLFIIFCSLCVLSSLFADDIYLSLKSSLFFFRIGVFSCFIWYLISKDKSILSFFYYSIIISFSILVIDGYYQFFFKENIFGLRLISNRVSSLFGNELILGSYLSRIFPLLFALFLIKKRKKKIEVYFLGLLFILVDILIFLSGERAAFLFLNLSTVFIIILIKEYQKFRLYTFLLGVIFIIILGNSYKAQFERMFKAPFKEMGIIEDIKYEAEGLIILHPP